MSARILMLALVFGLIVPSYSFAITDSLDTGIQLQDNTKPNISITTPLPGVSIPVNSQVTITGTSSDTQSDIKQVDIILLPNIVVSATPGSPNNYSTWSATLTFTNLGENTVIAKAVDNAENQKAVILKVNVEEVNTNPPSTSITSPPPNTTFVENSEITITGTASGLKGNITILVKVPGQDGIVITPISSNFVTWTVSTTVKVPGENTIVVKTTDDSGYFKVDLLPIIVEESQLPTADSDKLIFIFRNNLPDNNNIANEYALIARQTDMLVQFAETLLPPETNNILGERGTTYFSSEDILLNAAMLKSNGYDWIIYDIEPEFSPIGEINDPVTNVRKAAFYAHQNGLKIMVSPAELHPSIILEMALHVDGMVLQGQQMVNEPLKLQQISKGFVKSLRDVNPDLVVYLQMSTTLSNLEQLKTAYDLTRDIFDGTIIFYNFASEIPRLINILNYVETTRSS